MQALLLIAVFSLFMSIATNIVVGSGANTQQLTALRREETERFFRSVEMVINNYTRDNFDAPKTNDPLNILRNYQDIRQLASGHWADPAIDPWGSVVTGLVAREDRVLYTSSGGDSVIAPVTAIALISPGPNHQLETAVPQTATISALQGILPPVGSDDIALVFTNEAAQRENWSTVQHRLDRIAAAEMRYYQIQALEYRIKLMNDYLTQIKQTGALTAPDISQMMRDDPNAPQFLDLNADANRRLLGVDDDFALIERILTSGGRLQVKTFTQPDKSLTLEVINNPAWPTPWNRNLSFKQTLKGNI